MSQLRKELRRKKFVIGVPTVVRFRIMDKKDWANFKATKGTEVVKWSDILKATKNEIKSKKAVGEE